VVEQGPLMAAETPRDGADRERLMRYIIALENGPDSGRRQVFDDIGVETAVSPGQAGAGKIPLGERKQTAGFCALCATRSDSC
jgi:hypothetical protein